MGEVRKVRIADDVRLESMGIWLPDEEIGVVVDLWLEKIQNPLRSALPLLQFLVDEQLLWDLVDLSDWDLLDAEDQTYVVLLGHVSAVVLVVERVADGREERAAFPLHDHRLLDQKLPRIWLVIVSVRNDGLTLK